MPDPTLEELVQEIARLKANQVVRRKRPVLHISRALLAFVLILALAGAALGAVLLVILNQKTPPVQASPISSNCANLKTNKTSVVVGTSGFYTMDCGTTPAFQITSSLIAVYPGIPSLPANVTEVWTFYGAANSTATACSNIAKFDYQINGNPSPLHLGVGGWSYCATYVDFPPSGIPSFNITWSISTAG